MPRCPAWGPPGRARVAWLLASLLPLGASCQSEEALLLRVRTPEGTAARRYALTVQDRRSREVLYRSGVQQIDPLGDAARDLSQSPLRLGLLLSRRGRYFVHLRAGGAELSDGASAAPRQPELFFAAILESAGTTEVDAALLPVAPEQDQDGDHFPDAGAWLKASAEARARYGGQPELLDCVDRDPGAAEAPLPGGLRAADIHPLARPRCGLPLDVTCSGSPPACLDADGDGDGEDTDCDDRDPRRYHGNARPRNCCVCSDRASCAQNHAKLKDLSACSPPRCNSDFDYDCTGISVDCFTDDDCDGYAPDDPVPGQRDCDDQDPRVHPGATKNCADPSKDWACDGNPRGGCVDCDLDGDGFQRQDMPGTPGAHCPSADDRNPGKVDCDDEDRGVFPGSSRTEGATLIIRDLDGNHGGTVAAALRGLCRNTSPSGQPQDTDCDGMPRKNCPDRATCDADQDGFPRAACPMPGVPTDCDDNDPQTFPGAPDKCNDGKAQNCSTDRPCIGDGDGDGYVASVDCDDQSASIHPFAKELCDGKDNDCDGLIDELNPDDKGDRLLETNLVMGVGMVRSTKSCTDSNIGRCGERVAATGGYSGRCVCTSVARGKRADPAAPNVACSAADVPDNATTAPKCFFAQQPEQQTCDADHPRDEDCDGRTDAPDGKNLKEFGETCGVTTGECRAGKVIGCDRSRPPNPFSPAAGRNVTPPFPDSKRFLVCDDKTIAPKDEACNGKDDDCDGKLPGQGGMAPLPMGDEADHDGDKYLACAGCSMMDLRAGLLGCGDCDDTRAQSYPGAKELCDGRNNACAGAGFLDGKDDCTEGAADSCCPGTPMCVDRQTNFRHCGACGTPCSALSASACEGGQCRCGAGPACAGGTPVCKDMTTCVECTADAHCPMARPRCKDMTTCVECLVDADCPMAKPTCSNNVCEV